MKINMYKDLDVDTCKMLEKEFGNASDLFYKQTDTIVEQLSNLYLNNARSYQEAIRYVQATSRWHGVNEYLSDEITHHINKLAMNQSTK